MIETFADTYDPYSDLCDGFVQLIEGSSDEEFLASGVVITAAKWEVLLVPKDEEIERRTVAQLKEPLTSLFNSRRDLFQPIIESRSEVELLSNLNGLASWLSLRGYTVGIRGTTFWSKIKFDLYRGLSKIGLF